MTMLLTMMMTVLSVMMMSMTMMMVVLVMMKRYACLWHSKAAGSMFSFTLISYIVAKVMVMGSERKQRTVYSFQQS
jgi:hypothetical protein